MSEDHQLPTIADMRARLGVTIGELTRWLGVPRRNVERYLSGQHATPTPTIRLLMAAEKFPAVREWLIRIDHHD